MQHKSIESNVLPCRTYQQASLDDIFELKWLRSRKECSTQMFQVIIEALRKVSVIHAPLRAQAPRPLLLSYHILVFIQASKCYQITMTDLMGHITALIHRRPGIGGFGPDM
jgi:hypothetical protein